MDLASVPEITPTRFDVTDVAGFKAHLTEHGFAVVKCAAGQLPLILPAAGTVPPSLINLVCSLLRREAVTPEELIHARELLWSHFEGTEPGLERMQQTKPVGWKRNDVTTWTQGIDGEGKVGAYGEGAMTSTTHCVSRPPLCTAVSHQSAFPCPLTPRRAPPHPTLLLPVI